MNLVFTGLLVILSFLLIKTAILKTRKTTMEDERTQLISLQASRAVFLIFTITLALASFLLIYFGQHGRVPSDFIYSLGIITSYLTCLLLILYIILYSYFNRRS